MVKAFAPTHHLKTPEYLTSATTEATPIAQGEDATFFHLLALLGFYSDANGSFVYRDGTVGVLHVAQIDFPGTL